MREKLSADSFRDSEVCSQTDQVAQADFGQIVLVLQGGGALGAYQAGAYEAMHEAGIEPDWVIGTSIGAINASLIAGNKPEDRVAKLRAFWDRVAQSPALEFISAAMPWVGRSLPNWATLTNGVADFFTPNPLAFVGPLVSLAPEAAGYYSTKPLETTLTELVDFSLASNCTPRLTVGAANVRTAEMGYFDSRKAPITARHVMASGALPPAFPAVRIDGELYWDGGILSNTPVEAVFDDMPRRNSLIFAVHIWNPDGAEPKTITQVLNNRRIFNIAAGPSRRSSGRSRSTAYDISLRNWRRVCRRRSGTRLSFAKWRVMAV
jgi:NTE family protein